MASTPGAGTYVRRLARYDLRAFSLPSPHCLSGASVRPSSLSRVSWVSPLVLTGSFSSSHTSPGCSSEAPSQFAATVSRQKLQHRSSFLISSPGRAVIGLPASHLMFLCQVPTAHRQTRFNRVVDVLLTGVREGQVHASDAIVRLFLSRVVVRRARSPG